MTAGLARRALLLGAGAAALLPARPRAGGPPPAPAYLTDLARPGALPEGMAYRAPAAVHPAYRLAVYVNCAPAGARAQRMWVLAREAPSAPWQLVLWDADHWARQGDPAEPDHSWPVSTGRTYPGDPFSGPTPLGIFNLDERPHRHRPGWGSPGMYNALYIDLHYASGRASGVAMHGTPAANYRLLGRPESHGCIRMTRANADALWARVHPGGARGPASPLWGEVPRFFRSDPRLDASPRWGYVRDGRPLTEGGRLLTKPGYAVLFVFFRDDR